VLTACFCALQEALTRICTGTAHYSAARTLNSSEQPLFAAAAKALCDLVAPYAVSCYQRIYPQSTSKVDVEQATKALREVVQALDQEQAQKKGDVPFFNLSYAYRHTSLLYAFLILFQHSICVLVYVCLLDWTYQCLSCGMQGACLYWTQGIFSAWCILFSQLLSVDSPDESQRQEMRID